MLAFLLAAQLIVAAPEPVQPTPQDWQTINALVAPTHAPLKPWTHLVIASSVVAHMADLSTTSWAMGKGGIAVGVNYWLLRIHEQNPKMVLVLGILQTVAVGWVAHRNAQTLGLR
jgi:hypothetical protein